MESMKIKNHGSSGNNAKANTRQENECDNSPIFFNYENIVKVLIEHKVDANTANNNRDTPLFLSSGMDKVINSKSVNINKENKEWEYPLNLAKKGKEIHKDDVMVVEIYKGIIDLLT
ncbi:hypothetical protein H8356DRAFT_1360057 [Neocallimastix lanati (nom. inval.)]|nr:hypothetical protein H8356DRAFT_1360057 [Neocallimastix sp. JGI-2020a]